MIRGKRVIDGISVLDEKYLIPFKAKAWCELVERRKKGEEGQSRNIKKHCKDIADLVGLLRPDERIEVSGMVKIDMQTFVDDILTSEFVPGNVDGLELFRVAEYMRGNKFDSPEVAALSMEALKFVSDLDTLNNNMLEKSLKMDV